MKQIMFFFLSLFAIVVVPRGSCAWTEEADQALNQGLYLESADRALIRLRDRPSARDAQQ